MFLHHLRMYVIVSAALTVIMAKAAAAAMHLFIMYFTRSTDFVFVGPFPPPPLPYAKTERDLALVLPSRFSQKCITHAAAVNSVGHTILLQRQTSDRIVTERGVVELGEIFGLMKSLTLPSAF